jgi:hypothetical protein
VSLLGRMLDALLGPYCEDGCGHRVFPNDRSWHQDEYHTEVLLRWH